MAAGPAHISGVDDIDDLSPPEDIISCHPTHLPEADYNTVCRAPAPGLDVEAEAEKLMADDWLSGCFLYDLLEKSGATDIDCGSWTSKGAAPSAWSSRVVRATLVMPSGPMLPKTAPGNITYWVAVDQDEGGRLSIRIEADFLLEGVPYCECFFVHERHTLTSSPSGGDPVYVKEFGLVFKTRTFAKPMIQSNSLSTQLKTGELLKEFLLERGGVDQAATTCTDCFGSGTSVSDKSNDDSLTLEVWELQRRMTLFHSSWLAPFLPHDGVKRWRWVDKEYEMHPLVKAAVSRSLASLSDRPDQLIGIPAGWSPQPQGWSVVLEDPESTDDDGWQYAVDFYLGGSRWGKAPDWCHCRRRKWAVTYERTIIDNFEGVTEKLSPHQPLRVDGALSGLTQHGRFVMAFAALVIYQLLSPAMTADSASGWIRAAAFFLLSGVAALATALAYQRGGSLAALEELMNIHNRKRD